MTFNQILNVSIGASWLVLAIVLIRPLLKRVPGAFRCALWALVAVRLLCPGLPESSVSLLPTAQVIPETYLSGEFVPNPEEPAKLDIVTNPIYPEPVDISLKTSVDRLRWNDLHLTLVWWFGMGVMGLYALTSYLNLRLRTRVSVPGEGSVWLCDDIDSPFILGVIRPRICLPSHLSPEQSSHVIAHENAHLNRRDHWWKPLGFALLTIHWFNPVMWLGYILLCRDIELACDEQVIRDLDKASVRAYSEALLSCSVRQTRVTACPLAFGEVGVKERIRAMLHYKKPGFWILVTAAVVSVILAVCFLTNPAPTTIGTLREPQFIGLVSDADLLVLRSGERTCSIAQPGDFLELLKKTPVNPNEISRSLSEDRDRTYELINGSITLCISADFSEIWVDDSVKPSYSYAVTDPGYLENLLSPIIGGATPPLGTYVPHQCLYMNPLSSFYAWGGDSGMVYHLEQDRFTVERRSGYVVAIKPEDESFFIKYAEGVSESYDAIGPGWQPIDWDSALIRALNQNDGNLLNGPSLESIGIGEGEMMMQINADDFLVWNGERLLLLNTFHEEKQGRYLWSVYLLIPESIAGEAAWEFKPAMSSQYPAFRFEFDMEYTHISAYTDYGTLISFDEHSQTGYPSGNDLEFPSGTALYWAPTGEDSLMVHGAKIRFTVFNGEDPVAQGTLYIDREDSTGFTEIIYRADITGTGLCLSQNLEKSGGIIRIME